MKTKLTINTIKEIDFQIASNWRRIDSIMECYNKNHAWFSLMMKDHKSPITTDYIPNLSNLSVVLGKISALEALKLSLLVF
jgi:hypothetical protein